jgi:hypothetical protein
MFLTLFACNVAAGIFRVPRCRWADSSSVNNSRDFISGALLQGSWRGLKRRAHVLRTPHWSNYQLYRIARRRRAAIGYQRT